MKIIRFTQSTKSQRGFTIIELMIATSVLSVILLLVTSMMISIGALFYKGANVARIQDAVRSAADEVSGQLSLSPVIPGHDFDKTDGNINVYCMGGTRYSYVLNAQMGHKIDGDSSSPVYPHVLWRDNVGACDPTAGADLTATDPSKTTGGSSGAELVPPNSRLTAFCIGALTTLGPTSSCDSGGSSLTSPYTLTVGMVYGDDDLLNLAGVNTTCKGGTGDQFCAASSLITTVVRRLPKGVE